MKKMHWLGIILALVLGGIAGTSFFLKKDGNLLAFLLGIAIIIAVLPFVFSLILERRRSQEMTEMFLEFSRNLAESVATGTPVSKSIVNIGRRNYGSLTPAIRKLSNQISLGVPVGIALGTFAEDARNHVIQRAVGLIREAERSGGEIDTILASVGKSISEVDRLQKERKAAVYSLVVQGYIIFFLFIAIMLVMQFQIFPLVQGASNFGGLTQDAFRENLGTQSVVKSEDLSRPFLWLLLVQGLLAGLTIGKLAEGDLKAGIKHSFFLVSLTFLISTGAKLVFG